MLRFFFNGSPNPTKVALFLEESGLHYEPVPIDVCAGAQFTSEFLAVNPNGKVPAIDDDGVVVFDSSAILLYLAEKTGQYLPQPSAKNRADLLSWLMFAASGVGPYSGQAVHFKHFAPPSEYAHRRYQFEAQRHYAILDQRLSEHRYLVGDTYSIVDMAVWGWGRVMPFVLGQEAAAALPHLQRLLNEISARPAALRAVALKDRFTFKTLDEEARVHMFKHAARAS